MKILQNEIDLLKRMSDFVTNSEGYEQIDKVVEYSKINTIRKVLKLIRNFEPTKSNMMYDEVLYELERLVKELK